ncbi:TRADD-N-associated membrane domain-containing protein [Trichocoleus sp. FACHB-262]|uniref:TRADD-N-associated membrane domain-containing protein n=1 Tax=Trichocoleus sp. FACHB-262 TaxID=2692869 RepID=UPI001685CFA8|nr:hypothetical protein [Trichocoleus sp. FACHB-262]MBD2119356.1 hypothetical protein [Trichocoleus sp. FACHB-262]
MNSLIPSSKNQTPVEDAIIQERLRQAKYSFNLALSATAISACVGLVGFGLLLSSKFSKGTVTAAGGLASSACCVRFAKDANDRLDKVLEELSEFYKP